MLAIGYNDLKVFNCRKEQLATRSVCQSVEFLMLSRYRTSKCRPSALYVDAGFNEYANDQIVRRMGPQESALGEMMSLSDVLVISSP